MGEGGDVWGRDTFYSGLAMALANQIKRITNDSSSDLSWLFANNTFSRELEHVCAIRISMEQRYELAFCTFCGAPRRRAKDSGRQALHLYRDDKTGELKNYQISNLLELATFINLMADTNLSGTASSGK